MTAACAGVVQIARFDVNTASSSMANANYFNNGYTLAAFAVRLLRFKEKSMKPLLAFNAGVSHFAYDHPWLSILVFVVVMVVVEAFGKYWKDG